jgi:hypothetical protein
LNPSFFDHVSPYSYSSNIYEMNLHFPYSYMYLSFLMVFAKVLDSSNWILYL